MALNLGKKINLDLNYFVKNAVANSTHFIAISITTVLINATLARNLTQESFGLYQQFFLTASLLALALLPGTMHNLKIALTKGRARTIHKALYIRSQGLFLAIAILLAYKSFIPTANSNTLTGTETIANPLMLALILFLITEVLSLHFCGKIAKKQFIQLSKIRCSIEIAKYIAIAIAIYFTNNYVYILLSIMTLQLIMHIIFATNEYKNWDTKNTEIDTNFSIASYKSSAIHIWNFITEKLDHIVTIFLFGPKIYAIYAISSSVLNMLLAFQSNIISIYFPKIVEHQTEDVHQKINKNISKILLVASVICAVLIAIIPTAITIVFSIKYTESILPAQILIITMIPSGIYFIINQFYEAKRKYIHLYINTSILTITKAILICLFYKYGVYGLALATTLSLSISTAIAVILFKKIAISKHMN